MSFKSKFISFAKELFTWDKKLEIYNNGVDNLYPNRIEQLIASSPTATMAGELMRQYLIGKGFGDADNLKVGKDKLVDFADDVAGDISNNKGVFIQINYDLNLDVSDFQVVPFSHCRVGKKDSKDYNGKILVCSDWSDKKAVDKKRVVDVYNPDKTILAYQIGFSENDDDTTKIEKLSKYQGQIWFINFQNQYTYPLSRIHAVQSDCNSEALISIYHEQLLESGFYPRTMVVTRPLIDNDFIEDARLSNDPVKLQELRERESEREAYEKSINGMIGVRNAGGVMTLEMDFKGERLEDAILVKNLDSNINPNLFEKVSIEKSTNILMAFNNLPVDLVKASQSVFANNGSTLVEMKKTYWENTSKERAKLEQIINDLMRRKNDYAYENYLSVQSLIAQEVSNDEAQLERQKAQATLKGSVGGVQALMELIQNVAAKTIDYNSAIAIIEEIYGVSKETAVQLLGSPQNNIPKNVV